MNEEQSHVEKSELFNIKNKHKSPWIVLAILLCLVVLGFVFRNLLVGNNEIVNSSNNVEKTYTLSEVMNHNTKNNCWLIIEGNVYDITKFVSRHPGGEIIVSACGTDATEKFNRRPGKGTSHSALARKTLSDLRLGSLSN